MILTANIREEREREAYVRTALKQALSDCPEATPRVVSELTLGRVSTAQINVFLSSGVGGRETLYQLEAAAAALGIWPPKDCPFTDLGE